MASITIKNIPAELHACIKETASRNRRSINNELIVALEQLFLSGDVTPVSTPCSSSVQESHKQVHAATHKPSVEEAPTQPNIDGNTSAIDDIDDTVVEETVAQPSWLLSTPPMTSTYKVKPIKR